MITNKFELFFEVFAGEFPPKGTSNFLVSDLKIQQAFFYHLKRWKVIGSQSFFLNNGKIDFNLVKPAGMDG